MKKPAHLIYLGLFIILLGLGDNTGKLIPSWFAFLTGGFALVYGAYMHYKIDDKLFSITKDWAFDWKNLSSKVYIIVGILLMRLNRFVDFVDEYFEVNIFFSIIGGVLALYGLKLFFKEIREKKESGNIE